MLGIFSVELVQGFIAQWRMVHRLRANNDVRVTARHLQITAYDAVQTARKQDVDLADLLSVAEHSLLLSHAAVHEAMISRE